MQLPLRTGTKRWLGLFFRPRRRHRAGLAFALLCCCACATAQAADPCPQLRQQTTASELPVRIAAFACRENLDWFRPFIDVDGRSGGLTVYEAEDSPLADGSSAWRRVAAYWRESGLAYPGMSRCAGSSSACRAFVVDTPWSAAFISWVMRQAGVGGFRGSARHIDYVRDAWRDTEHNPYRALPPSGAAPVPGDLLCSVRVATRAYGYRQLAGVLDGPPGGLPMHCDIVVGSVDGILYMVGGNLQQAVTLRMLKLDADGRLARLPMRDRADAPCSPDAPQACNANRQDWAVLLKLKPGVVALRVRPAMRLASVVSEPAACGDSEENPACVPADREVPDEVAG